MKVFVAFEKKGSSIQKIEEQRNNLYDPCNIANSLISGAYQISLNFYQVPELGTDQVIKT